MSNNTLPCGWTGNARCHHRTVGPFRATVYFEGRGIAGKSYTYRIEYIRRVDFAGCDFMQGDKIDRSGFEAEQARRLAMDYLRKLATDILTALDEVQVAETART